MHLLNPFDDGHIDGVEARNDQSNFALRPWPDVSARARLPSVLTAENMPEGYTVVQRTTPPTYDPTTYGLEEGTPQMENGTWSQTWTVSALPVEQVQQNLAQARLDASNAIDNAAGVARSKYITIAPGQEGTYLMKAQRAREFVAAEYQGPVPILIQAEADATGATAQQACADILAQEAAWEYKAGQIEAARRVGKERVKAATTSEEINGHRDDALSALAQL